MYPAGLGVLMALQKQYTAIPLGTGIEQKSIEELIEPPMLIQAHNCVLIREGEITKRFGWGPVLAQDASGLGQPSRFVKRGDELIWIEDTFGTIEDGNRSVARSRVIGDASLSNERIWHERGHPSRFNTREFLRLPGNYGTPASVGFLIGATDIAFAGAPNRDQGVLCVAWRPSEQTGLAEVRYAVLDVATKAIIYQGVIASGGTLRVKSQVRVVGVRHVGTKWYFHVFYERDHNAGTGLRHVYRTSFLASTPWTFTTTDHEEHGAAGAWDIGISDQSLTQPLVFFFVNPEPDPNVTNTILLPSTTDSQLFPTTQAISDPFAGDVIPDSLQGAVGPSGAASVAVFGTIGGTGGNAQLAVGFDNSNGVLTARTPTSVITNGPTGASQVGWRGSVGNEQHNWGTTSFYSTDASTKFRGLRGDNGPPKILTVDVWPSTYLRKAASRPFFFGGQQHQLQFAGYAADSVCVEVVSYQPRAGDSTPSLHIDGRMLAGKIAHEDSWTTLRDEGRAAASVVESVLESGRFFVALPVVAEGTPFVDQISVLEIDGRDTQRFNYCELNGSTYVSGSIPYVFDGYNGHDLGFGLRPQYQGGSELAATGILNALPTLAAGTYRVALVWESVDAQGNRTFSAPSFSNQVTIDGVTTTAISLEFLGPERTNHQAVSAAIYVANLANGTYVRSKEWIPSLAPGLNTAVLYAPSMFQTGMPELYTEIGQLEAGVPPESRFVEAWGNRIWSLNANRVMYSVEQAPGEAIYFNEAQRFELQYDGTGMRALDDRLVFFCKQAIFWISGDGPTATGEGGAFTPPQRIATEFGCIDARSLLLVDQGIVYQSARGLELLDRGLSCRVISGGIDKLLRDDGYSEVRAASWDPIAQIARFALFNASTLLQVIACWHSGLGRWTTAGVPVQRDVGASVVKSLIHCDGRNWMALGDAIVTTTSTSVAARERNLTDSFDHSLALYLDGPADDWFWFPMRVQTAWIKLDGLEGFQRIWRVNALVKGRTPQTGVRMAYAVDYSTEPVEVEPNDPWREWRTSDDLNSGLILSNGNERFGVHVSWQQSSAISVYIEDAQTLEAEDNGTRFTLVALELEWGRKRGTGRSTEGAKK